jgi:site-specific recombinase XerD
MKARTRELSNNSAGGAADKVTALIGHISQAVSQVYTHLPEETLAKALRRLTM